MRKLWSQARMVMLVAGVGVLAAGCTQVERLSAYMAIRDGHNMFGQQNYRGAIEKYEEVVANEELATNDPRLTPAYFYLGNAYDNMYRPTRRGEAENDMFLDRAVEYYKRSAEVETDPIIKTRALQYLVGTYGPDKLNDPAASEPVIQQLIQMDPSDPSNYFALARLYEDNGEYERAEEVLMRAREVRPNAPEVYTNLAGFYERQDDFPRLIEALQARAEREPNNPEVFYTMAVHHWNKAYRDFRLTDAEKMDHVQQGLAEVDKALALNDAYQDALIYKGLLLRVQATLESNRATQQALLQQAEELADRAEEIRRASAAGTAGTAGQ